MTPVPIAANSSGARDETSAAWDEPSIARTNLASLGMNLLAPPGNPGAARDQCHTGGLAFLGERNYLVDAPEEGACHTKDQNGHYRPSCFYRCLEDSDELRFL